MFVGDINPIFSTGLLLGCTVLVATKNDIKSRRFRHMIFIVFSMILYLISLVVSHVYVFSREDLDLVLFSYSSLFVWNSLWNWKIWSIPSQICNSDRSTKFDDSSRRNKLRIICRITMVTSFSHWAIIVYLTYR